MVPGIQMNLFETGMEDHHNVADLFHLVSNSRQVGVWKYGIALCRWVLHSFGYSDFHHQWCLWWEVTTVLPAIGILKAFAHQDEENGKFRHQWFGDDQVCLLQALLGSLTRFAHQSGANENISSPMVWWLQCFATFSWRSKLEEYLYRSLDFGFGWKGVWWHASSPLSFENFTMEVVKIQMSLGDVLSPFCMLERQVMRVWTFQRWDIGFACMETSFKPMSFFWNKSKTNNLYKRVFDVFLSR